MKKASSGMGCMDTNESVHMRRNKNRVDVDHCELVLTQACNTLDLLVSANI